MWITAACFLFVWALSYFVLRLDRSFLHAFLVAAIGIALMNLVAHYWTQPETEDTPAEARGQGRVAG